MKARGHKTKAKTTRPARRPAARVRKSAATKLAANVLPLRHTLAEALEQQTAATEVLRVISRSNFDLQTVFDTLVEAATRLCHASASDIWRPVGDTYRHVASYGVPPKFKKVLDGLALKPDGRSVVGRCLQARKTIYVSDLATDPDYSIRDAKDFGGYRGLLCVPMMRENNPVGVLMVAHRVKRAFTEQQIALMNTFAAQAVIAIENARLLNELRQRTDDLGESLEQQTATSEVLSVISRSTGELQPVFDTILAKASALCEASYGALWLCDGDAFRTAAFHGALAAEYLDHWRVGNVFKLGPEVPAVRAAKSRVPVQEADLKATMAYLAGEPLLVSGVDLAGIRTILAVPMVKENETIGVIAIYRKEVRPFSKRQIELVQNFAAQAVIAIENTRLLNELRQRTDDLTEALEQQTATSEVLKAISGSPGELAPVFQAMLENATRICNAKFGTLFLAEGGALQVGALHNLPPRLAEFIRKRGTFVPPQDSAVGRMLRSKEVIHNLDDAAEPFPTNAAKLGGARTYLAVPMLNKDEFAGFFAIYRQEVRPFTDKQIELVQNFAAQAVIAIENTRLLNELRQRTDDLTESLEQQTATSEVLKVISSSPGELEPVFQAMLENATRICGAKFGILFRFDGTFFHPAGLVDAPPALAEFISKLGPILPEPGVALDRVLRTKRVVHSADYAAEEIMGPAARYGGARSLIAVPMFKDRDLVGAILIYRQEVLPFTDKQIELVQNFAAQAVIAIENTRLLNELRQRTDDLSESLEQQTATSEVLKVISSSPGELEPVFQTMLENATRICEAKFATLFRYEGEMLRPVAGIGRSAALIEAHEKRGAFKPWPGTTLYEVVHTKRLFHAEDDAKAAEPGAHVKFDGVGSSRVDLQACKLEYSIVSPK